MKAITVIESDDGSLLVTGSAIEDGVEDAVNLLHRGIEAVAARPLIAEGRKR